MKCITILCLFICRAACHYFPSKVVPAIVIKKTLCELPNSEIVEAELVHFSTNHVYKEKLNSYNLVFPTPKSTEPDTMNTYSIEFDSEAEVKTPSNCLEIFVNQTTYVVRCPVPKRSPGFFWWWFQFKVSGPSIGGIPYVKNIKVNNEDYCTNLPTDYLDNYEEVIDYQSGKCGHRIIDYTELVFNGVSATPGEWPWHTAIYRINFGLKKYSGAGTLIRENFVLTAAHVVTRGNTRTPLNARDLLAVLGKFNLDEPDNTTQEIEILTIIVHEKFHSPKLTDNDIALLKLKTNAVFNTFVQPACVFYDDVSYKLPTGTIYGSVVGWGVDESFSLSPQLKLVTEPERTYEECVRRDPFFYGEKLTNNSKFCAGWANGTSPCNGDSGGGFMVHIPGPRIIRGFNDFGGWFVKGIVALARTSVTNTGRRVCDPDYYVVYTDVSKYTSWIGKKTHT